MTMIATKNFASSCLDDNDLIVLTIAFLMIEITRKPISGSPKQQLRLLLIKKLRSDETFLSLIFDDESIHLKRRLLHAVKREFLDSIEVINL